MRLRTKILSNNGSIIALSCQCLCRRTIGNSELEVSFNGDICGRFSQLLTSFFLVSVSPRKVMSDIQDPMWQEMKRRSVGNDLLFLTPFTLTHCIFVLQCPWYCSPPVLSWWGTHAIKVSPKPSPWVIRSFWVSSLWSLRDQSRNRPYYRSPIIKIGS